MSRTTSYRARHPHSLTLERKDNSKGYFPDNCKWATKSEQAFNRRKKNDSDSRETNRK